MSVFVDNRTRFTYEDYAQIPEDGRIHEIIDGDHYMSPAPGTDHQTVSRRMQFQLYQQIELAGKGLVFNAPTDVQLGRVDIVQPDILVMAQSRARIVSPTKIVGAPDLVIEIASEHTQDRDVGIKLAAYERAGVPEYWFVEPEERTVRRYLL